MSRRAVHFVAPSLSAILTACAPVLNRIRPGDRNANKRARAKRFPMTREACRKIEGVPAITGKK